MEGENVSIKSIEEMWKVIESFGIKREVFQLSNPSYSQIRDLYIMIKTKRASSKG